MRWMRVDELPALSTDDVAAVLRRAEREQWDALTLVGPDMRWVRVEGEHVFRCAEPLRRPPAALLGLTALRRLGLPGQGIGADGARALAVLTGLDLGHHSIGDDCAHELK